MMEKSLHSDMFISPCKSICSIDKETRVCIGCDRTLEEIATWSKMTHVERMTVMKRLGYGNRRSRG
jgi:hypothetical protein